MPKVGHMTSPQVAKYWKYLKTEFIFGFITLKLLRMQVLEFLTQMYQEKLNFDLVLPHYAQIRTYDVKAGGQILEIFEK